MRSTSWGINFLGRLSPCTTPRTVRPCCKNGISIATSVPGGALPSSTQVPPGINASIASRNTVGTADVSIAWLRPPAAASRTLSQTWGGAVLFGGGGARSFAPQPQPMCVHINSDDRIATGDFCRHQSRQSDRADTEDGKTVAGLRLHGVENGSSSGLPAAGERPQGFPRRRFAHRYRAGALGA